MANFNSKIIKLAIFLPQWYHCLTFTMRHNQSLVCKFIACGQTQKTAKTNGPEISTSRSSAIILSAQGPCNFSSRRVPMSSFDVSDGINAHLK